MPNKTGGILKGTTKTAYFAFFFPISRLSRGFEVSLSKLIAERKSPLNGRTEDNMDYFFAGIAFLGPPILPDTCISPRFFWKVRLPVVLASPKTHYFYFWKKVIALRIAPLLVKNPAQLEKAPPTVRGFIFFARPVGGIRATQKSSMVRKGSAHRSHFHFSLPQAVAARVLFDSLPLFDSVKGGWTSGYTVFLFAPFPAIWNGASYEWKWLFCIIGCDRQTAICRKSAF